MALVETNVDRALELDIGRVWELEGAELGAQNVAVSGVEVLEQERVHRATEGKNLVLNACAVCF